MRAQRAVDSCIVAIVFLGLFVAVIGSLLFAGLLAVVRFVLRLPDLPPPKRFALKKPSKLLVFLMKPYRYYRKVRRFLYLQAAASLRRRGWGDLL